MVGCSMPANAINIQQPLLISSYHTRYHVEPGDRDGRVDQEIDGLLEGGVVLGRGVVRVPEQKAQQEREKQLGKQLENAEGHFNNPRLEIAGCNSIDI